MRFNLDKYFIQHAGPSIWNSILPNLRSVESYTAFKSNLKTRLLPGASNSISVRLWFEKIHVDFCVEVTLQYIKLEHTRNVTITFSTRFRMVSFGRKTCNRRLVQDSGRRRYSAVADIGSVVIIMSPRPLYIYWCNTVSHRHAIHGGFQEINSIHYYVASNVNVIIIAVSEPRRTRAPTTNRFASIELTEAFDASSRSIHIAQFWWYGDVLDE